VGGPHFYFDFLAAIKVPGAEEHHSGPQWLGSSFDPVVFDITDVNERLAEIKASMSSITDILTACSQYDIGRLGSASAA